MPFPDAQRIIYKKNPLAEVICQLRFPPILKIEKDIPDQFQDKIRKDFPEFHEQEQTTLSIPLKIQTQFPAEVLKQMMPSQTKNYAFLSKDNVWKVSLTRTFIALSTTKYERWEEFREKLTDPLQALTSVYEPAYFSRIGLRYVDIIQRSEMSLDDANWNELIKPFVLGLLGTDVVANDIEALEAKYRIRLDDGNSIAQIVTNLVELEKPEKGRVEECFVIDTDFYNNQKTDKENVVEKLEYFHIQASRLIQWLITERLHNAMEPNLL